MRTVCELAALAVPNLLQWQAMLPPNNPWSGAHSPALLTQVDLAGTSLVASVASLGQRTAQVARLWLADIDRRAGRREQALAAAAAVDAEAADDEVRGHVHLLRGDWAAAPLSSPAVWNCSLQPCSAPTAPSVGSRTARVLSGWSRFRVDVVGPGCGGAAGTSLGRAPRPAPSLAEPRVG